MTSEKDQRLILSAMQFAEVAHGDQKRKYTGDPYVTHTQRVAGRVLNLGMRAEVVAAAHLHDVVEDTPYTISDIVTHFGFDVARLVWEVTDEDPPKDTWPRDDLGKPKRPNRAIRKAHDREKLSRASAEGMTIKLADLIDNRIDISLHDYNFAVVYNREAKQLLPLLRAGDQRLYDELESLLYS
jgi:(p)ppGpp synthase/HD superfamily hydrolase